VSEDERRYYNGQSAQLLDIINVPVIGATPVLYQAENYVIDPGFYWEKQGERAVEELDQLLDNPPSIWTNDDSTYYGANDRVTLDVAAKLKSSLMLLRPEELTIIVHIEGAEFGNPKRRVRADFTYKNVLHRLIVTDPVAERTLLAKPNAQYKMKNTYLCISLGEAHTDG